MPIIRNPNAKDVDYTDTPFIKELNDAIEPILKKYFLDKQGDEACIILAIDSRDMGEIDGVPALAIKDKFIVYGGEGALIASLGKQLNNPDGFFSELVSTAWANNSKPLK